MLQITTSEKEFWNEQTEKFIRFKSHTFTMEHSLISISKWESKWEKPFLSKTEKSIEETLDYIKCMVIGNDSMIDNMEYMLSQEDVEKIKNYINAPMSAVVFPKKEGQGYSQHETITSELIYYWMIANQIPAEYEKWHLNRLLSLIRICGSKNSPKKGNRKAAMSRNAALNAARRAQYGSDG